MRSRVASLLLLLVGTLPARAAAPACAKLVGAETLIRPGAHIVVGEIHGNQETPAAAATLLCLAAQKGPTRLALEVPADQEPAFTKFLTSKGTDADRARLLGESFWKRTTQDGRSSAAMLALLESARRLRSEGRDVGLVLFDIVGNVADRDVAMADNLSRAMSQAPQATFIALVGNLHARRTKGTFKQNFMVARLVETGVPITALLATHAGGSSWACAPECGPLALTTTTKSGPGVQLEPVEDRAYDGTINLGAAHFSPPAAVELTESQRLRVTTLGAEVEANAAYDKKEFRRCAKLFDDLARRTKSSQAAYSAACCAALASDRDRAFVLLTTALDLGFNFAAAFDEDADLAALRSDPRWAKLRARLATAPAAQP